MRLLVTGVPATSAPRWRRAQAAGHEGAAFARPQERVAAGRRSSTTSCSATPISGAGLGRALDGVDAAYYLIHSMEGPANRLPDAERRAAERFATAARAAGVRRIVYLGGLVPDDVACLAPPRVALAVEDALLETAAEPIALRASIVIGARSRSFRFLVRLIERLPVLALPAWRRTARSRSTAATCSSSWSAPPTPPPSWPAARGTSPARRR